MRLDDLVTALNGYGALPAAWGGREVTSVVQDSRQAAPGALFVAVRGFHSDGHQFIPQAIGRGVAAVVVEERSQVDAPEGVALLRVPDSRKALAKLAAKFYGHPSAKLKLVGITGTKGKTTTSYLVRSILEAAGHRTGLIGTIDYRIGDRVYPAPNTTPESVDLQALLAEMVERGAAHCVMEVSSHALALGRTDGCVFEAAAFTHLAPEHLDFHASLEEYFQAKLKLFVGLGTDKTAVVNRDDNRWNEIVRQTTATVITYGLADDADIHPVGAIEHDRTGLRFSVASPRGEVRIVSRMVGSHNVPNILAAIGLGIALGCPRESIEAGISRMQAVPGRMETVDEGQPYAVIVDYAHTDDSLASLLEAVRDIGSGRIITVFGCGGDRDRTKRPRMGAAALAGSDIVVVTSDNPRTEDPLTIISEIETGMSGVGVRIDDLRKLRSVTVSQRPYVVIPDRTAAIEHAIGLATAGDVVVLAGKGHEDYQIIGDRKVPFDDREEARKAIRKRGADRA
jgi:UDP-N-acetylmuramoyl-L-alanyl-D-glutamate--2,6-diaminopimelate ligase